MRRSATCSQLPQSVWQHASQSVQNTSVIRLVSRLMRLSRSSSALAFWSSFSSISLAEIAREAERCEESFSRLSISADSSRLKLSISALFAFPRLRAIRPLSSPPPYRVHKLLFLEERFRNLSKLPSSSKPSQSQTGASFASTQNNYTLLLQYAEALLELNSLHLGSFCDLRDYCQDL